MNTTQTERPVIIAPSMLIAQSVKLDADCEAWMKATADRFRAKTGETGKVPLPLAVMNNAGALLGRMTYMR